MCNVGVDFNYIIHSHIMVSTSKLVYQKKKIYIKINLINYINEFGTSVLVSSNVQNLGNTTTTSVTNPFVRRIDHSFSYVHNRSRGHVYS
jgi:hypothetical protein